VEAGCDELLDGDHSESGGRCGGYKGGGPPSKGDVRHRCRGRVAKQAGAEIQDGDDLETVRQRDKGGVLVWGLRANKVKRLIGGSDPFRATREASTLKRATTSREVPVPHAHKLWVPSSPLLVTKLITGEVIEVPGCPSKPAISPPETTKAAN
jgi:hypothetical protein